MLNTFKELKERMYKQPKGIQKVRYEWNESIIEEVEIIKANHVQIPKIKSTIIEMKNC